MKLTRATPALFILSVTVGLAEPQPVRSAIDAVTVYSDRAEVRRTAELELPAGTTSLRFDNLPSSTLSGSLRLDGSGDFTLLDLKYSSRLEVDTPVEALQQLKQEERGIEVAMRQAENRMARLKKEDALIEAIGNRYTTTPDEQGELPQFDSEQWRALIDFQATESERIDGGLIELDLELEALKKALQVVRENIDKLGRDQRRRVYFADVKVESPAATEVALQLTYQVQGARWTPAYDLRADSGDASLELTYFGEVMQSTGESWTDVKLKLSTAQAMIHGRPPELQPWFLRFAELEEPEVRGNRRMDPFAASNQMMATPASAGVAADFAMDEQARMKVREASADQGATAVTFAIEQATTVPADGTQTRVFITQQEFPVHLRYSAVPKLNEYAYLKAKAVNASDFPFLAGKAAVFLDKSYVSTTQLDLIAPAEEFWVFLGVDQGIAVERRLIEDKGKKSGIIRNKRTQNFAYQFEITNNKRKAVELVLWDQVPKSTDKEIEVELVEPKVNDETIKRNDQDFIEWIFNIAPGAKVEPMLEFKVTYPEDKMIEGL